MELVFSEGGGGFSMFPQDGICGVFRDLFSSQLVCYVSLLGWCFVFPFFPGLFGFPSWLVCCVFNILSGSIGGQQPAAQSRPRSD